MLHFMPTTRIDAKSDRKLTLQNTQGWRILGFAHKTFLFFYHLITRKKKRNNDSVKKQSEKQKKITFNYISHLFL